MVEIRYQNFFYHPNIYSYIHFLFILIYIHLLKYGHVFMNHPVHSVLQG